MCSNTRNQTCCGATMTAVCKGALRPRTLYRYDPVNPRLRSGKDKSCIDDELLPSRQLTARNRTPNWLSTWMGSHGPAYYHRYPGHFCKFTPTCDTNEIQDCDHCALMNTYDNTILYTDSVVKANHRCAEGTPATYHRADLPFRPRRIAGRKRDLSARHAVHAGTRATNTHSVYVLALSPTTENLYQRAQCLRTTQQKNAVSQDNLFSAVLGMMDEINGLSAATDILERIVSKRPYQLDRTVY